MSGPLQELARSARRWPQLVEACKAPAEAQAKVWSETKALLDEAPFWRARHGGAAPAIEAHEPTVYSDYAEAVEATWASGQSALSGAPVVLWALSSGSSGRQKRFPWTQAFIDQHREGSDLTLPVFEAIARRKGRGPLLALVATSPRVLAPSGSPTGYASNLLGPDSNPVYPRSIDYSKEAFTTWMPLYAAAADLGGIRAVSCDHVLVLVDQLEKGRERYLSVLDGSGSPPEGLPAPAVTPTRLDYLREVLLDPAPLSLATLWPQLRVIHTWRSATAGLQARMLLTTAVPGCQLVDFTYAASEGPIANPIDPDGIGGPIHPGSVVHEFLELGAQGRPDEVLKAWELEVGRRYEVLMTTKMGLVRYRIGDVVECTGWFHRTPTLRFVGRVGREISLGVTTFSESELTGALAATARPPRVKQVFGPGPDGRALVLYTTSLLSADDLESIHRFVRDANDTYRGFHAEGRMAKIRQELLPPDHPVWSHCEPQHAQSKPRFLIDRPIADFVGRPSEGA